MSQTSSILWRKIINGSVLFRAIRGSYLRIEATSMIRGMSNENPAELRDRLMLKIWSAYDVTGDVMRLFAQRWSASTNPSGSSAIL